VPTAALLKGRINMKKKRELNTTILISIAMIRVGILFPLPLLTSVEFLLIIKGKEIAYTFYLNSHIL
jgi:hypothetical protein